MKGVRWGKSRPDPLSAPHARSLVSQGLPAGVVLVLVLPGGPCGPPGPSGARLPWARQ